MERLADTEEIQKIESRFTNLISRTFLKGAVGVPASQILNSVKKAFSSKTYEIQLDKIIDDIYIASVAYADQKAGEMGPEPGASSASRRAAAPLTRTLAAAKNKPLPITAEAIKQTKALTGDAAESVTRWLKDEGLYTQHPDQLARQVKDLWDGERYKARRFAVTFTADLAENTAIHRYNDLGIIDLQFYAEIDEKTTPQCRQFHGTIIKANSRDAQRYRPPLHFHCRSCLIPATSKTLENENLLIENRDFTQHYDQNFKPLKMRTDIEQVNSVLDDIGKFNEKYRIDQFILDEDIQLRLMKLNLSIVTEKPNPTLKKWLEPEKVKPPKPKYPTGPEIREKIPEVLAKHEAKIKAETDTLKGLTSERDALRAKQNKLMKEWQREISEGLDIEMPKYKAFKSQIDEISVQLDIIDDKFSETMARRTKLMYQGKNDVIKELLYINEGERTDLIILDTQWHSGTREEQGRRALEFFNKTVNKDVMEKVPNLQVSEIGYGRSSTSKGANKLWMDNKSDTGVLIHEIAHNIEYNNPEIWESAKAHIAKRTAGEIPESLRQLTGRNFDLDEFTRKDKFFDPYIGKVTKSGYTELTSMATQYLYDDPEMLARVDPETFDWIINTLRGQL